MVSMMNAQDGLSMLDSRFDRSDFLSPEDKAYGRRHFHDRVTSTVDILQLVKESFAAAEAHRRVGDTHGFRV